MIANPSPKQRFKIPEGCKGSYCRKCVFKKQRPCLVSTFIPIETTRIYDEHSRPTYKVSTRSYNSTKYNRAGII